VGSLPSVIEGERIWCCLRQMWRGTFPTGNRSVGPARFDRYGEGVVVARAVNTQ